MQPVRGGVNVALHLGQSDVDVGLAERPRNWKLVATELPAGPPRLHDAAGLVLILSSALSPGLATFCIPPIVWPAICRIMPLTGSNCSLVYR
jgi:hypothetical protein